MELLSIPWPKPRIWARRIRRSFRKKIVLPHLSSSDDSAASIEQCLRDQVLEVLADSNPFILVQTTTLSIQEHLCALEAFRALQTDSRCRIVILGTMSDHWDAISHKAYQIIHALPRKLETLPDLFSEELDSLIKQAAALLMPVNPDKITDYIRSSNRQNKHILAPNSAQNRALYGGNAVYYDHRDAQSIAFAMRRVLDSLSYEDLGVGAMQADIVSDGSAAQNLNDPQVKIMSEYPRDNNSESSHNYNSALPLYFLHIPKTAGTSVRILCEDHFSYDQICPAYFPAHLSAIASEQAASYHLFRGHHAGALYPFLKKPLNTFTWMRSPMSWLVSNYSFQIQERNIPETMSFQEWLEVTPSNPVCHFLTITTPLSPDVSSLSLLDRASEVLKNCFMIGMVEKHDDSINILCHQLGLYPPEMAAAFNRTSSRRKWEDFSAETTKRAEAMLTEDMKLYSRAVPLFEAGYQKMLNELHQDLNSKFGDVEEWDTWLIRELLRERYFTKLKANPLLDAVDYTFDQPLIGEGWGERMTSGPQSPYGCARGIADDKCGAVIYLPIQKRGSCTLRFGISEVYTPKALAGMRLEVNDTPVPIHRENRGHPHLLSEVVLGASISSEVLQMSSHYTKLVFSTDSYIRPVDENPFLRDTSKLMVALNWISTRSTR